MKKRRAARKPDALEVMQNKLNSFGKRMRQAIWNAYGWIGLAALIVLIVKK